MNPLEFIKFTARSNCGDCGHPTCLAFAVAVTKGGESAEKCPHLDPDAPVEMGASGAGIERVERMGEERDLALAAYLSSKIRDMDFRIVAPALGATFTQDSDEGLAFTYLGREIAMGKEALRMAGEALVDPRDQILLYNYVHSGGGPPPSGDWIGLESLPNSISKVRTLAVYCENRLADRFSGRAERLRSLCLQLGATPVQGEQSAAVAMVIPVLPHLPQQLLFWDEEPEDGFSAKVKILFDRGVMDFLDLESLVFSAERLAERLADLDA